MQIKHPELLEKLEKSGFSDKVARVYLSVLELGGAFPSKVAEYSGLNRSTVYHILLTLSVRGLVNEIEKRNKIYYQIEKPERFVRFTKDQIRLAEDRLDRAKSILPDIEGLYSSLGEKPKVTYYEGDEGILAIYQDHISSDKPYEMLAWANAVELREFLPVKFFDSYVKAKEKIGITTRGIIPDTEENRSFAAIRYSGITKKIWPEMKFLSPEQFPLKGEITLYGINKVSIVNFEKTKMIGTLIEDEAIHKMLTNIFNISWESRILNK